MPSCAWILGPNTGFEVIVPGRQGIRARRDSILLAGAPTFFETTHDGITTQTLTRLTFRIVCQWEHPAESSSRLPSSSIGQRRPDIGMVTQAELWSTLQRVRQLRFEATSESTNGWNGHGSGSVIVSEETPGAIVFSESGAWQPRKLSQSQIRFTNTFKWTALDDRIRLEHLRFGPNNPVYLFDLVENECGDWHEDNPHKCSDDCYRAILKVNAGELSIAWSVTGPNKRESIAYTYW